MKQQKNIAVIGYPNQPAVNFISLVQGMANRLNLLPKTIGMIGKEEKLSFRIGTDGQDIKVHLNKDVDIFLGHENLIVVDFSYEINHVDFYRINNIRHIIPGENLLPEEILEVIFSDENK